MDDVDAPPILSLLLQDMTPNPPRPILRPCPTTMVSTTVCRNTACKSCAVRNRSFETQVKSATSGSCTEMRRDREVQRRGCQAHFGHSGIWIDVKNSALRPRQLTRHRTREPRNKGETLSRVQSYRLTCPSASVELVLATKRRFQKRGDPQNVVPYFL